MKTLPDLKMLMAIAVTFASGVTLAVPIDDRLLTETTPWLMWNNVDAPTIINSTANNFRPTDLEITNGPTGPRFSTTMVKEDSGTYAQPFWWYYGDTLNNMVDHYSNNLARLIALRPYVQPNGSVLFASLMVGNSGANSESWWNYVGLTQAQIDPFLNANHARLVDLKSYIELGQTHYSVIMVDNTGANAQPWWWYYNVTAGDLQTYLSSNHARLYSLSRSASDPARFDAILTPDDGTPWAWLYGVSNLDLLNYAQNNHLRVIDVEQVPQGGEYVYDGVMLGQTQRPVQVPEPDELLLFASALGLLAVFHARRRRDFF